MNSTSNIVLLIHTYFLTLSQLPFLLPPAPPLFSLFSFFFFLFSSFFFLLSSIFLYQPLTYNNTIHFHCPFFHFFATYLSPPPPIYITLLYFSSTLSLPSYSVSTTLDLIVPFILSNSILTCSFSSRCPYCEKVWLQLEGTYAQVNNVLVNQKFKTFYIRILYTTMIKTIMLCDKELSCII